MSEVGSQSVAIMVVLQDDWSWQANVPFFVPAWHNVIRTIVEHSLFWITKRLARADVWDAKPLILCIQLVTHLFSDLVTVCDTIISTITGTIFTPTTVSTALLDETPPQQWTWVVHGVNRKKSCWFNKVYCECHHYWFVYTECLSGPRSVVMPKQTE